MLNAPALMASAVGRIAFERYSKIVPHCKGPYRAINMGYEYAKIVQDDVRKTISIKRLTRVAKEGMRNMEFTSVTRTDTGTNLALETSTEKKKNSFALEKIFRHESLSTRDILYCSMLWLQTPERYCRTC